MHPTIERVVAKHIDAVELERDSERRVTDDLRTRLFDAQSERGVREARFRNVQARVMDTARKTSRMEQLLDQLRTALGTEARGHDMVKVADDMRRERDLFNTYGLLPKAWDSSATAGEWVAVDNTGDTVDLNADGEPFRGIGSYQECANRVLELSADSDDAFRPYRLARVMPMVAQDAAKAGAS